MVMLEQVADVGRSSGRYMISHQGTRRVQTVTANASGRDVADFAAELEQRLRRSGRAAEPGSMPSWRARRRRSAQARAGAAAAQPAGRGGDRAAAVAGLRRARAAAAGARQSAVRAGRRRARRRAGRRVLSLGSLVGFVTLFGIATRNAVMLISHYDHLVTGEGATWGAATALRGASERLGPILMTATVTALALLPLALGSGDPGREIEGPMAMVILGGLVTSTLLSLFVLPTLALRHASLRADLTPRVVAVVEPPSRRRSGAESTTDRAARTGSPANRGAGRLSSARPAAASSPPGTMAQPAQRGRSSVGDAGTDDGRAGRGEQQQDQRDPRRQQMLSHPARCRPGGFPCAPRMGTARRAPFWMQRATRLSAADHRQGRPAPSTTSCQPGRHELPAQRSASRPIPPRISCKAVSTSAEERTSPVMRAVPESGHVRSRGRWSSSPRRSIRTHCGPEDRERSRPSECQARQPALRIPGLLVPRRC